MSTKLTQSLDDIIMESKKNVKKIPRQKKLPITKKIANKRIKKTNLEITIKNDRIRRKSSGSLSERFRNQRTGTTIKKL